MAGERDPGSDVEMAGFIEFGHRWGTRAVHAGCAAALLALAGCEGRFSTLDPAGPAAARIAELWWVMFAGAMLILAGVMAAALYSLRVRRRGRALSERRVLIGWGLVFPLATLLALMAFAFLRGEQLLARPDGGLELEAQARQWQWRFGYPGGAASEGVLHIPAGRTVHMLVASEDVIHSFWVPRLAGKIDAIPGRVNRIAIRADRPGRYWGQCAEYCGPGHAHMPFTVLAHPPDRYAAALATLTSVRPDDLPVLQRRRSPALDALRNTADYVLEWLGIGR